METADGGPFVLGGIIRPVISASPLTWFIRYIFIDIYSNYYYMLLLLLLLLHNDFIQTIVLAIMLSPDIP